MTSPAATSFAPSTYTSIGTKPFQLIPGGNDSSINIYNGDITNVLLVSHSSSPVLANSVPIQPLTNLTVTGSRQWYACALSGTCQNVTVSDAANMAPSPAQIAAQISALGLAKDTSVNNPAYGPSTLTGQTNIQGAVNNPAFGPSKDTTLAAQTSGATIATDISNTGAPLLNLKTLLSSNASLSLPASTTTSIGPFTVTQVGYEFALSLGTASANATPVQVRLIWTDPISGLNMGIQEFALYAGTTGAPHIIAGHGPSNANQLTVRFITPTANAATANYSLLQTSRPFTKHFWRTINTALSPPTIPGFVNFGANNVNGNIVLNVQDSIAASSSKNYLMPLYTGNVYFNGRTDDGTQGNGSWRLQETIDTFTSAIIEFSTSGSGGYSPAGQTSTQFPYCLPRSQCQMQYNNLNTTTAHTLDAIVLGAEQEV